MPDERTRRSLLAGGAALLGSLAGCGGGSAPTTQDRDTTTSVAGRGSAMTTDAPGDGPGSTTDAPGDGPGSTTDAPDDESGSTTDDLDLQEANVTEVAVEDRGDGRYRFDVTLYHDDDGEDGYADWWQVEGLDGEQLGRRKLLHAHSTAPFTRSETIPIPDGVDCVVVRGHDQTHGYGGQAMVLDVASGRTRPVQQGPDPGRFSAGDCP